MEIDLVTESVGDWAALGSGSTLDHLVAAAMVIATVVMAAACIVVLRRDIRSLTGDGDVVTGAFETKANADDIGGDQRIVA